MNFRNIILSAVLLDGTANATVFTFVSNGSTGNNAYASTVDLGPSIVAGADLITIDPSYGTTPVGFYDYFTVTGLVDGASFTTDNPDVQVDFNGNWLSSVDGVHFDVPFNYVLQGPNEVVVFTVAPNPETVAFAGMVSVRTLDDPPPTVPEPAPLSLVITGLALLGCGFYIKRHR